MSRHDPERIGPLLQRSLTVADDRLRLAVRMNLRCPEPIAHSFPIHQICEVKLGRGAEVMARKMRVIRCTRDRAAGAGGDAHDLVRYSTSSIGDPRGSEFAAAKPGHHHVTRPDRFDGPRRAVGHGNHRSRHQALVVVADHGHVAVVTGE